MKFILNISCCLLFKLALAQPSESFHLIKYSPPTNWTVAGNEGARQYMFSDPATNNYCVITIYGAANSSGSPESDFLEEWKTKVLSIATASGNPVAKQINTPDGFNYTKGGKLTSLKNGAGNAFMNLYVFRNETSRQGIVIASATEKTLETFKNVITNFVASIKKNNMPVTGLTDNQQESASGANLVSNNGVLYVGMQAATEGFNYGNSKRYLYLGPENYFRWGYTQEGYYNYHPEADKAKTPDFAGTFTKVSGKITLNFYSGRKMEFITDKGFNLQAWENGNVSYQLTKFPQLTNHKIEGEYTKTDLIRDLWPNGVQPKAKFFANGRFEDNGLLCMGEAIDVSLPLDVWKQKTIENQLPGKGTYSMADNSLLLNYDDGRKKQLAIYIFERDIKKSSPELIVVAGQSFTAVK